MRSPARACKKLLATNEIYLLDSNEKHEIIYLSLHTFNNGYDYTFHIRVCISPISCKYIWATHTYAQNTNISIPADMCGMSPVAMLRGARLSAAYQHPFEADQSMMYTDKSPCRLVSCAIVSF